jgi:type IV pilus assembly protein PilO
VADLGLNKLPWYGQLAVFVTLSLAGAGAFYYFYETPRQEAMAVRQNELNAIQARISVGLTTARQLPEFRAEVDSLTERLESLKTILPDEKDVAELLRRIQMMAAQSDLTIRTFRPQAINTQALHAEWPIGLELEGSYHNLGLFLDRVSKFPRIINVSDMVLLGQDPPAAGATLRVSCTATTFVLLDTPAGTAAPAGKKAPAKAPARKSS